jgi:histidinol-phosphate aminotransferase
LSWRDRVRAPLRAMRAYHVPPAPGPIKLDANESPWPTSERMREVVARAVAEVPLHRYPDPRAGALREALAARLGVDGSQLVLGNGSDEIIALLCAAFGEPVDGAPARVLYPAPSFVMYRHEALAHGLQPIEVPLGPRFGPDVDAMCAAIAHHRPSVVFLATPNNPTGTVWPPSAIDAMLAADDEAVVVVDEAYLAYGPDPSRIGRLAEGDGRCVVLQTLSKIGLAALRVGYLVAQREVCAELEKVRSPYNLDAFAQAAGTALVTECAQELDDMAAVVRQQRAWLYQALAGQSDLELFPSGGNFILARHQDARAIDAELRRRGIAVRRFDGGALDNCMRITVGTHEENGTLVEALRAILA